MARVLVGHAHRRVRRALGHRPQLGRELGHVAHRGREPAGLVGSEQLAVLLHRRAAAGGGDDHALEPAQGRDRRLRPPPRLVLAAGVQGKRAAAALPARHDDLAAVGREHGRGGAVHPPEEHALHAALEQRRPHPRLAPGRHQPLRPGAQVGRGHARREREGANAGRKRPRQGAQEPRPGGEREHAALDGALAQRPRRPLAAQRPRALDEDVVAHAARAGGHARQAAEAAVEVAGDRRVELDLAAVDQVHQVDAAAGRVHLVSPERVGRARRQAEPAVHAGVEQLARLSHRRPPPRAARAPRPDVSGAWPRICTSAWSRPRA